MTRQLQLSTKGGHFLSTWTLIWQLMTRMQFFLSGKEIWRPWTHSLVALISVGFWALSLRILNLPS